MVIAYLKLLETFVLGVLMDKTEYNFFHKNFRPVKLLVILLLTGNVAFTVYLLAKFNRVHEVIVAQCPSVFETSKSAKPTVVAVDSKKK